MNKRIKELAKQARDYVEDAIGLGFPKDQVNDIRDEKFAELIVRECLERGNDLAKHYINKHPEQEQAFLLAAIADYSSEIKNLKKQLKDKE